MNHSRLIAVLAIFMSLPCVAAQEPAATQSVAEFEASLDYQRGTIELPGGLATLEVPREFRYLGPADAHRVLEEAWGNPPRGDTLGMLFPSETSPLDEAGWGVVITYDSDGHVSDEEADSIDYVELLEQMQEQTEEHNAERTRMGYEALHLVGWAEPPSYDATSHKLYWAKELKFGDAQHNTLNYNIRVLGREGVLVLNAVAGMDQLSLIRQRMPEVVAFSNFNTGQRYTDFNESTDKVAAYGLAALIGGAAAAKTGLLAKLVALLLAAKKFGIVILVAVFGGLAKLLRRKKPVPE